MRNPIDLAMPRICTMTPVRCLIRMLRISWRLIIFWCSAPRSFTGWRSPTSASVIRASVRASFTSFFVFDSVIIFRRQGFATYTLKPMPVATSLIQRQCVPVSKVTGDDLSCVARNFPSPSFVVGIVASCTTFRFPLILDITQILDFLSLTSIPIAV